MSHDNQDSTPHGCANAGGVAAESPLLTYDEVSSQYKIPKGTLYWWVRRRSIPFVRLGPRSVRFRRRDLEKWIESRVVRPQDRTTAEER